MATYGWGTNEPIIAPEAEGGENIGTVCVKIKSAITDTFTKLNSETWADASTTASGYMSASDKIKLNGIETGAEVNQFAFSNISVGGTTISADTKQDTLTLTAGTGITLTPDAGNDRVTINFDSGANVDIGGSSASCTGNAASATKLVTGRTFRTNLASTATASFNGTANVTPGVTGILPVANGGTGNASGSATSLVSQSQNNGIISAGTDGHFQGAAFQAREVGYVASTQTDIAYAPRISWHWGDLAAGNLLLDRWASFHFTSQNSDTIYLDVNARDFFSKNRNCWFAPQPTTSAGVGQIFSANPGRGTNVTVPSGGTWCVCKNNLTSESAFLSSELLICSGGTVIAPSDARLCVTGIRIA